MRELKWSGALMCALALAACGDDSRPPIGDAGPGTRDGGDAGRRDAGPVRDGGGTPDGGDPCEGIDCSDMDDACNVGTCTGGTCSPVPRADGTTCDDEDACTMGDACTAGTCGGTDVDCSGMTDMCNVGTCDAATGACTAVAMPDGTACDDGVACTATDVCSAGSCAGAMVDCSGMTDDCGTGICDPTSGACTRMLAMDGTACDDSNPCTTVDACAAGACAGGAPVDCTGSDNACNVGVCDMGSGTCGTTPRPDGTACATDPCSLGQSCSAGACGGGMPVDCSMLTDMCNVGTCDPMTGTCGAVPVMDGTTCDDGDPLTSSDVCTAGVCAGCTDSDITGPWAFGHQPNYTPRTLTAAATSLSLTDDSVSAAITMPFTYTLFDTAITDLRVSSNGFVRFNSTSTASGCCTGGTLPSSTIGNAPAIAAFWNDLNPGGGTAGTIRHEVLGTAPNREWVLEFAGVPHFGGSNPITVQVVLPENAPNEAEVICINCPSDGDNHTQGIQSGTGAGNVGYALPGRAAANFSLFGDSVRYVTGRSTGPGDGCGMDACERLNPNPASASLSGGDHAAARSVAAAPRAFTMASTITLTDDSVSSALPIGFDFTFFGNTFNEVYVSSNGFITFTSTTDNGCCSGGNLPDGFSPGNMIAAFWEDLNPGAGGTISYETQGAAPNREWVLEFNDVPHFAGTAMTNVTFQIVLRESGNEAEIICTNCPADATGLHTQGVQNGSRSFGYSAVGRENRNFSLVADAVIYRTTSGEANVCGP